MKRILVLSAAVLATAAAACGSSSKSTPAGFQQPAGTVAVSFTVDDTANKVFKNGELLWKGSMVYDGTTRKITYDGTWGGPWAPLFDDGPWDQGGHEPLGAVAGDHKWGVTVFATPPATGTTSYGYGLVDHAFGDGWIWVGANGGFDVASGATAPITAAGMTLAAFGTIDMQLTIDTSALSVSGGPWDTSRVAVKGGAWAWGEATIPAPTSGTVYTFLLSSVVGAGHTYFHTGLLNHGDEPQFVFVFGPAGSGKEYKDAGGVCNTGGVEAATKASGALTWTSAVLKIVPPGSGLSSGNTYITVP